METSLIPQISQTVYEVLVLFANNDMDVFAILDPHEDDASDRRKEIEKDQLELNHLVTINILRNVSNRPPHLQDIKRSKEQRGVSYKVFELTEMGKLLFKGVEDRKVN